MKSNGTEQVGKITLSVINKLNINTEADTPIYLGLGNIKHMKAKHPREYSVYSKYISYIIEYPDYIGRNKKDCSIEYVKEFKVNSEHVKIAVRVSGKGKFFVRTMYTIKESRVKNFVEKGTLLKP